MKNLNRIIAAVDIGTTKIVTLIGQKNENNKFEILAISKAESTGVKRGVVLNIEETVNSIMKTVEEAQTKSGLKINEVFVGIAGQHIRSVRNRGYVNRGSLEDEIKREDIQALINDMYKIPIDAGEEIIHVIPQNYIVDSETGVKNPVGMVGRRLEANFHIVIGNIASAKNIEKCVNRVGLKVRQLILEPLASSQSVLTEDEKEAGVALVDIGGGTTDIAVYYDGIVWHTAVIPFGGNVVTKDIKEGCGILPKMAEALKVQYGAALADNIQEDCFVTIPGISGRGPKEISYKNLAYIIQARMEEILDAVVFQIENSGVMEKLSAGIVITGGGSLLKDLPQLVRYKTGMDVRVGYPCEHLAANTPADINHPMYSTAIGLILKGDDFMEANKELDFVKVEVKNEKVVVEEFVDETKETEEKTSEKSKLKGNFFESIKKTFNDIFDENDAKM